jgi:hypothetical protein
MTETHKLHFGGKFIGEVPNTGDMATDLKAMSELMRSRGIEPLNRAQAAFGQASAFGMNAAHLFNTGLIGAPPLNPANLVPFVVNAAFAIELYLKTLGSLYDLKMHGHDLLDLLEELPAEAKELLRREIAMAPPSEGIKDLSGFRSEIERLRSVFVDWRYLYERRTAPEVRIVEFIHIVNLLHNTCRKDDRLKPPGLTGIAGVASI